MSFSKFGGNLFSSLNFDHFPFLCQLSQERAIYLKRTPYYPLFERTFETAKIFVMEGSKQVLVKVMLFQLREHVHPQDGAMPIFYESKSSLLVLSVGVSFVLKIFWKFDKNFKNSISGWTL